MNHKENNLIFEAYNSKPLKSNELIKGEYYQIVEDKIETKKTEISPNKFSSSEFNRIKGSIFLDEDKHELDFWAKPNSVIFYLQDLTIWPNNPVNVGTARILKPSIDDTYHLIETPSSNRQLVLTKFKYTIEILSKREMYNEGIPVFFDIEQLHNYWTYLTLTKSMKFKPLEDTDPLAMVDSF